MSTQSNPVLLIRQEAQRYAEEVFLQSGDRSLDLDTIKMWFCTGVTAFMWRIKPSPSITLYERAGYDWASQHLEPYASNSGYRHVDAVRDVVHCIQHHLDAGDEKMMRHFQDWVLCYLQLTLDTLLEQASPEVLQNLDGLLDQLGQTRKRQSYDKTIRNQPP